MDLNYCPGCGEDLSKWGGRGSEGLIRCMKCSFPLQKVGGFWLVQKLGEGGFGAVYKAIHEYSEDIEKAVKLLHKSLYDDTSGRASQAERSEKRERWLRRFQREVGITAKLARESWHIVRIDDVGELPELGLYYVMEYLRGQTLEELLKGNTAQVRTRAYEAFKQMCEGLSVAHEQGVVHCDLKPENIFLLDVSENGRFVKILDFGIAKILGASRSTTVGRVVGSVYYMAPEQWKSEPLDARTDVYALGCIFHKILTGRLPYEYETANELMFAHVMQDPRALGEWRPELRIPEELDRTVLWALKKDPAERPQTVKQFWAAISRFERWLNVGLKGSTKEEYIPPSGPQGYVPERSDISGISPPISSTAGGRMRLEQGGIGLGGIAKPEQPIMPGSTARLPKHDLSASVERPQQIDAVQQGGQRKLWVLWLIIGLLLLINAGVVGYFLSQDKQKEQVSVVRPVSEIPQQGKAEERKTPVRSGEATLPRLPDAPVTPEIRRDPPTPVVKQPPPKPKVQPKLAPKPKAKEFHEQLEQLIPKISEGDMLSSHKPMPRVTTSSALPKPRRELSPIAKCRTLLRNKRYQSAKKCLDALVKQLGQKAPSQVHFLLGETTAHLGQCFDVIEKQKHILCFEAREHYRRYLKLAPNTPSAAKVRKMLNTTTTTVQPKPPPKPKAKPKPPQKNRYSIQERQARARHVMVRIPGGPFLMGSPDGEGWEHEKPQLRINLPMYYIDKYEVSVEQYRRCVVAGSCKRAHFTTSGENSNCNYGVSGKERHPMNCVNWYGARAYCAWAGKRLCNEAEWEKAARGTDGRKYPWGNSSPNCSRARYHDCGRGMVPVDALSAGASPIGVRLRPK